MIDSMSNGPVLGRILGINVRVSYALMILTGLLLLLDVPRALGMGAGAALAVALSVLALPVCVFLHEMGHSLAAFKEGLSVPRITLLPFGGLAEILGQIPGPYAEIFIAIAGPCVSLALAALAAFPLLLAGTTPFGGGGTPLLWLLTHIFQMNLILFFFNLLPIFPMDGGRVALAAMILRYGPARGMQAASTLNRYGCYGMMAVGGLIILGGNPVGGAFLILIGLHLRHGGLQEIYARQYAESYARGAGSGFHTGGREPWSQPHWSPETGFDRAPPVPQPNEGWFSRWRRKRAEQQKARDVAAKAELDKDVDAVLAKVKAEGIASLTPAERALLNKASQSYQK